MVLWFVYSLPVQVVTAFSHVLRVRRQIREGGLVADCNHPTCTDTKATEKACSPSKQLGFAFCLGQDLECKACWSQHLYVRAPGQVPSLMHACTALPGKWLPAALGHGSQGFSCLYSPVPHAMSTTRLSHFSHFSQETSTRT